MGGRTLWLLALLALAALLAAVAVCTGRDDGDNGGPPTPETAGDPPPAGPSSPWSADPALDRAIAERGRQAVLDEIRAALGDAPALLDGGPVTDDREEAIVQAMRWAAILGDGRSGAALDDLIRYPFGSQNPDFHYTLVYSARRAAWQIDSAGLDLGERLERLDAMRTSGETYARIFAEDRLLEIGAPAIEFLVERARRDLLPRIGETVGGELLITDPEATMAYNDLESLLVVLADSIDDQSSIRALARDPDPKVRALAATMLEPQP